MTDLRNSNVSLSGILKLGRFIPKKVKDVLAFQTLKPIFLNFSISQKLGLSSQEFHTFISEVCYNYVKMLYHIDPEFASLDGLFS